MDIGERFIARPALADTPRDHWTFGDDPTVFARMKHHGQSHAHLREKLGDASAETRLIVTEPGIGFRFKAAD